MPHTCPQLLRMCENIAKVVCRSTLLKSDDYRLKSLTPSHRFCNKCDQPAIEDITHLIAMSYV